MNNAAHLWIDITDLYNWSGAFTGIQNVVDNYVQAYLPQEDARLFIFLPHEQRFAEVPKDEWRARREAILHPTKSAAKGVNVPSKPSIKRRVYLRSRHIIMTTARRATPAPLKRQARAQLVAYRERKHGRAGRHPFRAGDTVLIIGGNWGDDFRGFAEGLAKIRKSQDIKLLHVIHDILPISYPNYFSPSESFRRYFTTFARVADGFLANSLATQKDMRAFLQTLGGPAAKTPVVVFRLGEDFAEAHPAKPPLKLDREFILCVGTIEGRKNHALLYNVVKLAQQKGVRIPQIVIAGRRGWMTSETLRNLEFDPDIKGRVVISHTIDDDQKAWLFKHCLFTVYPSFCEGWGLPVVESLHNGKVCITSNTSSLPEAGGKYADYVSPYDAGEMLEHIVKFANDKTRVAAEKNIQKRPTFTWEHSFVGFSAEVTQLAKR